MAGTPPQPPGVWKNRCEAKAEQPLLLQASTFQTYCVAQVRWLVLKLVPLIVESSTKLPVATSFTATS
jgi:hypothetical protein